MTRRYIAATERNETSDGASISIYNVRTMSKRRSMVAGPWPCTARFTQNLQHPTPRPYAGAALNTPEFTSLAFSLDDAQLLALGCAPFWKLAVFRSVVSRGVCTKRSTVRGGGASALLFCVCAGRMEGFFHVRSPPTTRPQC